MKDASGVKLKYKLSADNRSYAVTGVKDGFEFLKKLVIPSEYNNLPITEIGVSAFLGCKSLKSVKIPYCVRKIELYTFRECTGLEKVEMERNITNIGMEAFFGCSSLKEITFAGTTDEWVLIWRDDGWKEGAIAEKVVCIDGEVYV